MPCLLSVPRRREAPVLPALPTQCGCLLGVPFNIASYALLVHMFAQQCDLEARELIWTGGTVICT